MKKQNKFNSFKRLFVGVSLVFLGGLVLTSKASASEGRVSLRSSQAVCEASSFWNENNYEIVGKCDGLIYPFEVKFDHYYVWAFDSVRDSWVRVDDIERGYFEGKVDNDFTRLMITAEESSNPRRPSDKRLMSGNVEELEFRVEEVDEVVSDVGKNEAEESEALQDVDVKDSEKESGVGQVVGKIFTAILAIIVVVIVLVVVGSLVFRKRGSVSE